MLIGPNLVLQHYKLISILEQYVNYSFPPFPRNVQSFINNFLLGKLWHLILELVRGEVMPGINVKQVSIRQYGDSFKHWPDTTVRFLQTLTRYHCETPSNTDQIPLWDSFKHWPDTTGQHESLTFWVPLYLLRQL